MTDQNNHEFTTEGEFDEKFTVPANEHGTSDAPHKPFTLASGEKMTPEQLGEAAIKFATETAYAAAGLADKLAARAKELYESQRVKVKENTPEGVDPNFRQFVDQMPDQFKTFMDEATKAYHEMAERGRVALADLQSQVQAARVERETKPSPAEAFDLKDGAQADAEAADMVAPEDIQGDVPGDVVTDAYPGESKDENRSF